MSGGGRGRKWRSVRRRDSRFRKKRGEGEAPLVAEGVKDGPTGPALQWAQKGMGRGEEGDGAGVAKERRLI